MPRIALSKLKAGGPNLGGSASGGPAFGGAPRNEPRGGKPHHNEPQGGGAPRRGPSSAEALSHFLTGALTTTAASPCTVPLMAPAVAFAFSRSHWEIFSVFLFLGLGLSSPYLLLSRFPRLLRRLPGPKQWMERLKIFLALPLFGTALWLFWILSFQLSPESFCFLSYSDRPDRSLSAVAEKKSEKSAERDTAPFVKTSPDLFKPDGADRRCNSFPDCFNCFANSRRSPPDSDGAFRKTASATNRTGGGKSAPQGAAGFLSLRRSKSQRGGKKCFCRLRRGMVPFMQGE